MRNLLPIVVKGTGVSYSDQTLKRQMGVYPQGGNRWLIIQTGSFQTQVETV